MNIGNGGVFSLLKKKVIGFLQEGIPREVVDLKDIGMMRTMSMDETK